MSIKAFGLKMLVPIFLISLSSMVNFVTPCCEEKERISTLVDTAIDIMSKVKLQNISCNAKPENISCPEVHGKPLDCADLYKRGYNKSGVYTIWPNSRLTSVNHSLNVFCDMDDGGWTVIQRRGNFGKAKDFFDQDWKNYKIGFGELDSEFWLGNDNIFAITNQRRYSVYFALESHQNKKIYAHYDNLWIDDEFNNYTLHISGYSGTAGDPMGYHNEMKFSTKDRDNDNTIKRNCAKEYPSGWWFNACFRANLNGINYNKTDGIEWHTWSKSESLLRTEIKLKPIFK